MTDTVPVIAPDFDLEQPAFTEEVLASEAKAEEEWFTAAKEFFDRFGPVISQATVEKGQSRDFLLNIAGEAYLSIINIDRELYADAGTPLPPLGLHMRGVLSHMYNTAAGVLQDTYDSHMTAAEEEEDDLNIPCTD